MAAGIVFDLTGNKDFAYGTADYYRAQHLTKENSPRFTDDERKLINGALDRVVQACEKHDFNAMNNAIKIYKKDVQSVAENVGIRMRKEDFQKLSTGNWKDKYIYYANTRVLPVTDAMAFGALTIPGFGQVASGVYWGVRGAGNVRDRLAENAEHAPGRYANYDRFTMISQGDLQPGFTEGLTNITLRIPSEYITDGDRQHLQKMGLLKL